jgi:hypothetical protein
MNLKGRFSMSRSPKELNSTPGPGFQLLLAHAEDHQPVLDQGLEIESAREAPKPTQLPGRVEVPAWERPSAPPNDLVAQRWGVIVPEGEWGDSLLRAIAPLIEHREKEQGGSERTLAARFRVPPGQGAAAAVKWRNEVLRAIPERERPKYLLILGDLHHVSLELQQVLAHSAYVGRLHVGLPSGAPDLAGYTAYAHKVVAHETRTDLEDAARALLYTARDGTPATELGHQLLVRQCLKVMHSRWKEQKLALDIQEVTQTEADVQTLLRAAGELRAGVMLSVSHGLGAPRRGWASPEEQRDKQGALALGSDQTLTADMVREHPFLPGGMWFCVACFGAATPSHSAFYAWLSHLEKQGIRTGNPKAVLRSLPREGERPFLSALPQALLANRQGPLAIIGHSDLAWVSSFAKEDDPERGDASRILSSLEVLAEGSRAGLALDALMRSYREVNEQLMAGYQAREDAALYDSPDPTDPVRQGHLWMLRNDLRGYLLLGDPAARLPIR